MNFGCQDNIGFMCKGAFHVSCFQQGVRTIFQIFLSLDFDNSFVNDSTMVDEDPICFKERRGGDHLLEPFQCDTCHFVNIQGRLPRAFC